MTLDEHFRLNRNLKILRKATNYTQLELADELGICRTSYSQVERGLRLPDVSMLQSLSRLYEVPIDMLLNSDIRDVLGHHFLHSSSEQQQALIKLYEQLSTDAKEQLLLRAEELCQLDMLKRIQF